MISEKCKLQIRKIYLLKEYDESDGKGSNINETKGFKRYGQLLPRLLGRLFLCRLNTVLF